ncbi:MAG: universal stress protein [Caulobacterales bacterium]
MLRDLLVHVDGDEAGRQRVAFTVELALRTGARLTGLHVRPPPEISPRYKPSQVDAAVAQHAAKLAADAHAAREFFESEAGRRLSDARWIDAQGDIVDGVSTRARFADLVVLGQSEWQHPPEKHPLPIAHSIVLRCGRPVLVVPAGVMTPSLAKVAVAWDGSREAVRAVHDALPILELAQVVHLVAMVAPSGVGDEDAVDVGSLLTHLANHGISVEPKVETVASAREQRALQRKIRDGAYDLLVMGAYSHPMWLEFIFGGATRSQLMTSEIPIFVSH